MTTNETDDRASPDTGPLAPADAPRPASGTGSGTGTMINGFVEGATDLPGDIGQMVARRRALLGPAYRLFYERPLHLVRGEGVWLYDARGRAYLDAYNNVAALGHCHPRVVRAIAEQAGRLATHTRYLHDGILDCAERILATLPDAIGHVMFTCSGSEANDLALRIARAATGGQGVIVTETAYHGVTQSVAEFSPSLGPGVALGAHVRTVPAPDSYRMADPAQAFTTAVEAAIADLRRHGIRPALFICDALFTSDGVFATPGVIAGAVAAIRRAGGLYVADEVQSGFARSGEAFWGFERHGVTPDLVTMGKPMGNGYPVAAVAMRPEVIAGFGSEARYFNTFGGNAVAAEAAQAVLSVLEEEGLMAQAQRVGRYMRARLHDLQTAHPCIGDVRGAGLFVGVEIVSDPQQKTPDARRAGAIVNGLCSAGVLISACGKGANVLKIRPPLIFTEEHAELLVTRLDTVLKAL